MRTEKVHIELPVIIGSSSKINGDLEFSSDVLVDGEACGKLSSERRITIGGNGFFKGTLYANDLVVFGRLDGDIIVNEHVFFHSNCTINGCLYTKYIELEDGANLNAKVIMSDNPKDIYVSQTLVSKKESNTEVLLEKGKRNHHLTNPGSFFSNVFEEMDREMVAAQINCSTSTGIN